jgi:hypothetical protein
MMCLIQLSVTTPHCGNNIFKYLKELLLVAF